MRPKIKWIQVECVCVCIYSSLLYMRQLFTVHKESVWHRGSYNSLGLGAGVTGFKSLTTTLGTLPWMRLNTINWEEKYEQRPYGFGCVFIYCIIWRADIALVKQELISCFLYTCTTHILRFCSSGPCVWYLGLQEWLTQPLNHFLISGTTTS